MLTNPIVIEQECKVSILKVWNALTDKNEMKYRYFNLPEFIAKVGFEFRFYGGKDENNQFRMDLYNDGSFKKIFGKLNALLHKVSSIILFFS